MQRGRQMIALRGWCTSPLLMANPPFQSRQAQLESGVRGNVPAPFGAGERLQSPTYRYPNGGCEAILSVCCRKTSRPTTNSTLIDGLSCCTGSGAKMGLRSACLFNGRILCWKYPRHFHTRWRALAHEVLLVNLFPRDT